MKMNGSRKMARKCRRAADATNQLTEDRVNASYKPLPQSTTATGPRPRQWTIYGRGNEDGGANNWHERRHGNRLNMNGHQVTAESEAHDHCGAARPRPGGDNKPNELSGPPTTTSALTTVASASITNTIKAHQPHPLRMGLASRQQHRQHNYYIPLFMLLIAALCCPPTAVLASAHNDLTGIPSDDSRQPVTLPMDSTTPVGDAHDDGAWPSDGNQTASSWPAGGDNATQSPPLAINDRSTGGGSSNIRDSIFLLFARRFTGGNELWDDIIRDCYERPSFTCFQKNVYTYLSGALESSDVNITQRLKFFRNSVRYDESAMEEDDDAPATESAMGAELMDDEGHLRQNEIPHTGRAADADLPSSPVTPIEEVTNALYGKSVKFAMTHDMELKLPDMLFDGATFRISPKRVEGNGIIAKLELIPKQEIEARLAGKILKKKIQKFFRNKVLLAFIALVLIIKIIKIKLFWLLPLIIGVGAAKKLLLKFLLFLFPALSHLFKLCSHYQQTYHSTKYHHHHHLINHHHTVVPAWHNAEHNHPGPELIYTQPPKGHVSAYLHGAPIHETYGPPSHEHFDGGWENSGPGLGSEYISNVNRNAHFDEKSNEFVPHTGDAGELHSWGLGPATQATSTTPYRGHLQQQQRTPATQQQRPPPQQRGPPGPQQQQQKQQHHNAAHLPHGHQKPAYGVTSSQTFNPFASPGKLSTKLKGVPQPSPQLPANPVYTPQRNGELTVSGDGLTAAQIAAQYDPVRHSQQQQQVEHQQQQQQLQILQQQLQQQGQQLSPEVDAQLKEAIRIQTEHRLVAQQQRILENQPFVQDGQPIMPKNYDPFYSPILLKIDKIVEQLGIGDELCKERLVCSMYKDPSRYSPHSNFVSAELSRDTNELEPVTSTNPAVVRFYRLIQAARDGQEQKDCLRLYPQCTINTE